MQQKSVVLNDSGNAQLYRRTAPTLLAYLLRQVSSREDAEDLLLEVFLAALENEQFKGINEEKQLAWLRTVARYKVADYYRRFTRHPGVSQIVGNTLYASASHVSVHSDSGNTTTSFVFAFRTQDGHKLWQHDLASWLVSSPTVVGGVVYVGTFAGNVYALKAGDGSEVWKHNLGGRADLQPPIVSHGSIYVEEDGNAIGATDNTTPAAVSALDMHGNQLWQVQSESAKTRISMQAVANGVIYISQFPGQITASDARSGRTLWHQRYGASYLDKRGEQGGILSGVVVAS